MTLAIAADPIPLKVDADGNVRVGGTRVTLDTVIWAFNHGKTAEAIVRSYSTLKLADVYAVIAYYLRHRPEVDTYLERRARNAEAMREAARARFAAEGWRERLLARRGRQDVS